MAAPINNNIRGKILESAAKLLHSAAFTEISLTDIARAAGISKGTLYYYYNNKNDILFDIADRYLAILSSNLLEWTENKEKDTSLRRLLHYTFTRGIFDQSGNLRLYLIGEAVSGNEELRKKLLGKYLYFKKTLSAKIKERCPSADAEYMAWMVLTVMDGLLVQSQLKNPQINVEDFTEKTVSVLLEL